jgi:peptidoglycan/LPS O-acetylase OafA/YrhL
MDGFRALAIFWVFLIHIWISAGRPELDGGLFRAVVAQGYLGVDILFIVSGFVLFLPVAVNGGSIGSVRLYALRRAVRLVPPYFLALLVVLAFHDWINPAAVVPMPWDGWHGAWAWLSHMLFVQMYAVAPDLAVGFAVVPAVWTLTVEMTFYFVLPFVARAFHRRPLVWTAAALAAAELWQAVVTPAGMGPTTFPGFAVFRAIPSFPTYMGHFALGMLGAWLYVRYRDRAGQRMWRSATVACQVVTGGALLAFFVHRTANSSAGTTYLIERVDSGYVAILAAAFMLVTALAPRWAYRPFSNPLISGMGDASYGVYLTHFLLIQIAITGLGVMVDGSSAVFWQLAFFTIPPAIALGYLSCRFVEQPARAWARRRPPKARVPDYPPLDLVPAVAPEPTA